MKKTSSRQQPQCNDNSEPEFFETFAYPSVNLSAFLFVPGICEFVISLRESETVVRYRPTDTIGFILWLWKHKVRDISCQVERMLMAPRN